jgi:hypothetical protein
MIEPWSAIRARLVAEHYRPVIFLAFECWQHGKFRAVVSAESKRERRRHQFYCPTCNFRCAVVVLARGLRAPGPLPAPESISAHAAGQAQAIFDAARKKGTTHSKRRHGPPLLTGSRAFMGKDSPEVKPAKRWKNKRRGLDRPVEPPEVKPHVVQVSP